MVSVLIKFLEWKMVEVEHRYECTEVETSKTLELDNFHLILSSLKNGIKSCVQSLLHSKASIHFSFLIA